MNPRSLTLSLASLALPFLAVSCDRPPVVRNCDPDAAVHCPNLNDPAGRIEGTLIYQGPRPPSDPSGRTTGRIVLLLFAYNNPPAPEGSATTAISFQALSASQLFQDAHVQPDGSVFATSSYSFPNITAPGEYQVRAFYSHNETISYSLTTSSGPVTINASSGFQPLFSVRNLPVEGDVGGGAIVDTSAAIPQFRRIAIGVPTGQDARGNTLYSLPDEGFVVHDVTVFLGKVFDTERPMYHVITDSSSTTTAPFGLTVTSVGPPPAGDPTTHVPTPSAMLLQYAMDTGLLPVGSQQLNMPRNYTVQHGDTGEDLPAFSVSGSFDLTGTSETTNECAIAAHAGVLCASDLPRQIGFFEQAFDRNQNGTIDLLATATPPFADAHPTLITTSSLAMTTNGHLPWVYPLVILSKLHEPTLLERSLLAQGDNGQLSAAQYAALRQSLNQPEGLDPTTGRYPVLLLGSVLPGGAAANLLLRPWPLGFTSNESTPRIGIIPIAIEIHGPDPLRDWWAILPPATPDLLRAAVPFLPSHYRCWDYSPDPAYTPDFPQQAGIPYGRYAINIFNPNGQAWSLPNELSNVVYGGCPDGECHALSQATVVRVGAAVPPPADAMVACPDPPECPDPANPNNPGCRN